MPTTKLEERSIPALHHNRRTADPHRTQIITRRKDGRLTDRFHHITRGELEESCDILSEALMELGVEPGDHFGILSPNRPRWMIAASAVFRVGGVVVTVYPTLTVKESGFIVGHADIKILFVGDRRHLDKALALAPDCPLLSTIVVFEPMDDDPDSRFITYDSLLQKGRANRHAEEIFRRTAALRKEDPAAIIYTSGTTGVPKGVVLTHGNLLSQLVVLPLFDLSHRDVWLSHLPLCHSFGFAADFLGCLHVEGVLGMSEGLDADSMREALNAIRPTVLMSVPRLYEKLYARILSILGQRPKALRKLFWAAHGVGLRVFEYKNQGKQPPVLLRWKYKLAKKILTKVREKAGLDKLRIAYGGGGPLSADLMRFYNGLGIDIYQGYGLTETSPVATLTTPGDNKLGTVGRPVENVTIKLDKDGEILIKGPNVMKEYYKDPEETRKTFTPDGFFRSGDIGAFDEAGRLIITDRKKEIIITSAGKNIAPMPIETAFNTDPYIERVILIGDRRNYLTALVSPCFEILRKWGRDRNLSFSNDAELVADPEVIALIQERIDLVNADLARFESIKKFCLVDHEFSEENGVLTPSQKVKRRVVTEKYKDRIDAMYGS